MEPGTGQGGGCGLPVAGSHQQEEEPVCPALRSAAAELQCGCCSHTCPSLSRNLLCGLCCQPSAGVCPAAALASCSPASCGTICLPARPSPARILPQALSELGSCRNIRFLRFHQHGFLKAGVPNLWDPMPDDLRWNSRSTEKLSSTKTIPGAKKVGDY